MMNKQIDIPVELYSDEVVCFLADRYHTSSEEIMLRFLVQGGIIPIPEKDSMSQTLEENEMEILRGLTKNFLYRI